MMVSDADSSRVEGRDCQARPGTGELTDWLRIHSLRAGNGDATLIQFPASDTAVCNILVDGGNNRSDYRQFLRKSVEGIIQRDEVIDLLVVTHQDQDHIKGIQWLLQDLRKPDFCPHGPALRASKAAARV